MGANYATCGISYTPIMTDDSVVVFVLREAYVDYIKTNAHLEVEDIYYPIGPVLRGVYRDDTLQVEEVTTSMGFDGLMDLVNEMIGSEVMMRNVQRRAGNKAGKVLGEDMPEIKDLTDFVHKLIERELEGFTHMLVHEEVYEEIVKEYGKDKTLREGRPLSEVLEEHIKIYVEAHREYDKERKKRLSENNKEDRDIYRKLREKVSGNRYEMESHFRLRYFDDYKLVDNNEELQKDLIGLFVFKLAMVKGRRMWAPQIRSTQIEDYRMVNISGKFAIEKEIRAEAARW